MFRFVFELIKSPIGLPINPLREYVILAIIEVLAFKIAWEASPGGKWGSEIHWIARIIAFIAIWAVTYGIIVAVKWIFANWILILSIIGGAVIVGGITAIILLWRRKRKTQCEK